MKFAVCGRPWNGGVTLEIITSSFIRAVGLILKLNILKFSTGTQCRPCTEAFFNFTSRVTVTTIISNINDLRHKRSTL